MFRLLSRFTWIAFPCLLSAAAEVEDLPPVIVTAPAPEETAPAGQTAPAVQATLAGGGDLLNALRLEPGLHAGGAPGSALALRGITLEGSPTFGTRSNPALTVVSGDIPRSATSLWVLGMPVWDTVAVETLRGPVLFRSAPPAQGGGLFLEPAAPAFRTGGLLLAEAGGSGYYRSGVTENLVLAPGELALRLNAAAEGSDGGVTNVVNQDDRFAASDKSLLRGQLRWHPGADPRSVIDLTVESETVRGNPLGFATTLPGGSLLDRQTALNTPEKSDADHTAVSLRGKMELDQGRWVEGEFGWQETDGDRFHDLDAGRILSWYYGLETTEDRLTGGLRLRREQADAAWTLGLYGESSTSASVYEGVGFTPVPQGGRFLSRVGETVDMAAVFAEGETVLSGNLWLTGGVRVDHQHRTQTAATTFPGKPDTGDFSEVTSTELLPALGLDWRRGDARAGLSISRSFRPGASAFAASLGSSDPYGAERGWETDFSAENQWDAIHAAARAFYASIDGQQVAYTAPGGIPVIDVFMTSAAASTRAGAELELDWQGPGALTAGLSGGWLFTEYRRLTIAGEDRSGQALPSSPEWSTAFRLAWNPQTGWFGETSLTWQDTTCSQTQSPETTRLESRLQLAARAGFRWHNAELYLFGTNLTGDDFALVRQDNSKLNRGIEGRISMPRIIGAGFSLHW